MTKKNQFEKQKMRQKSTGQKESQTILAKEKLKVAFHLNGEHLNFHIDLWIAGGATMQRCWLI